jgi:hypothetical protein
VARAGGAAIDFGELTNIERKSVPVDVGAIERNPDRERGWLRRPSASNGQA